MSGEIRMTIDAVREIANRTMGTMKGKAQSSSRALGDVDLPPAAFGGWHEALALGRHHQGAHEVFMKTLEGVLADLEEFEQNLRDTADSSERRDQDVEASLLALGRGYRDRTFRSQESYTAAVQAESGLKGVDPDELAAEAAVDVTDDAPSQPPVADQPAAQESDQETTQQTAGPSGQQTPRPSF